MSKYIKSLKYTDPTTGTTYTVDSRAVKSSSDSTKTMDDLLAGKANTTGTYTGLTVGYANSSGSSATALKATAADDADTLDGMHASSFLTAHQDISGKANGPVAYTFTASSWSGSSSAGYTYTITLSSSLGSSLNMIAQVYRLDSSTSKYTTVANTSVTVNSTTSITLYSPTAYAGKCVVIY